MQLHCLYVQERESKRIRERRTVFHPLIRITFMARSFILTSFLLPFLFTLIDISVFLRADTSRRASSGLQKSMIRSLFVSFFLYFIYLTSLMQLKQILIFNFVIFRTLFYSVPLKENNFSNIQIRNMVALSGPFCLYLLKFSIAISSSGCSLRNLPTHPSQPFSFAEQRQVSIPCYDWSKNPSYCIGKSGSSFFLHFLAPGLPEHGVKLLFKEDTSSFINIFVSM